MSRMKSVAPCMMEGLSPSKAFTANQPLTINSVSLLFARKHRKPHV